MSTSVKLSEEDKKKLEKLQALVTLKAGAKIAQQDLLSRLINEAMERSDDFVKKIFKASIPLSNEEYDRVLSLVDDWGVETNWTEIDQSLYGTKDKK